MLWQGRPVVKESLTGRRGQMKKPEIKYVGWCHECKYLGSFHCGICQRENLSVKNFARLCLGLDIISPFGRPSEFISKNKNRWVRM